MNHFESLKLEKPNLSRIDIGKAMKKSMALQQKEGKSIAYQMSEPNYLYWDKIKHLEPPKGFSALEVWFVTKQVRRMSSRPTFIKAENEKPFNFLKLVCTDELLHRIDLETGGSIFAPYQLLSDQKKQKFLTRGIIEEAIASSQLEGANTTRKAAKDMIIQKREPRNRSERMIINNYKAMQVIEQDYKKKQMSIDLMFELHRILTDQDSEIPSGDRGRFRTDKDQIVVHSQSKRKIVHTPPKEAFLKKEISRFVQYANDEGGERFVHPIIKAIFLHFWIGYLHPFTDGNGRFARAIFYWYLLKHRYWTMIYLPISTVIKKSPEQYSMAYVYAEQDDLDITYFYDYHLKKIIQALDEFHSYVNRKVAENKEIDSLISKESNLNDRQKQSIHYLMSEGEGSFTTVSSYMSVYGISRLTASKDLHKLGELGYLQSRRSGKYIRYYLTHKLSNS
ncbi:MAG: Fic family protein [Candidatus Peribacteraceae bacterium]|nr:Fic family protein [Candidatus Peribacteraceae bacterium]